MQTVSATGEKALGFRDPDDWAVEIAKRDELYAEDPTCDHCEKPIAEKAEATVLYLNRLRKWKLAHVRHCALGITNAEVERIRAKQGRAECFECTEPCDPGFRLCPRHHVQSKL